MTRVKPWQLVVAILTSLCTAATCVLAVVLSDLNPWVTSLAGVSLVGVLFFYLTPVNRAYNHTFAALQRDWDKQHKPSDFRRQMDGIMAFGSDNYRQHKGSA